MRPFTASLANGIYDKEYHMSAKYWMTHEIRVMIAILNANADMSVNMRVPRNTMVAIILVESNIF
jgi:hypothetical protein